MLLLLSLICQQLNIQLIVNETKLMPEIRGCFYYARGHTPALAGGARELRVPALEKSATWCLVNL